MSLFNIVKSFLCVSLILHICDLCSNFILLVLDGDNDLVKWSKAHLFQA